MTMEQPAGPGRQQVPADNRRGRPARSWYWLAAGLLAGALAMGAFGVHGVLSLPSQVAAFQRVPVPGQGGVIFDQPGLYLFYIEKPDRSCCTLSAGGGRSPAQNGSIQLRIVSASGGPPAPIRTWRGIRESYVAEGHQGQAGWWVTISKPGRYLLRTGQSTIPGVTDVAVGPALSQFALYSVTFLLLAGAVVLGAASCLTAGITAFLRIARRRPAPPPGPM
jgi:hypothetical protein